MGYERDPLSGVFIPEGLLKSKYPLSDEALTQGRGVFFSQLGKSSRYNASGSQDKPPGEPSFRYLWDLYNSSLIDQIIVLRRQQQVRAVTKRIRNVETEIGWRIAHKMDQVPNFEVTEEIRQRCEKMADILEQGVNRTIHRGGLIDMLTVAVEQQLVLDRKALLKFDDLTGKPRMWYMLPGDSIQPIIDVLMRWIDEHHQGEDFGPDMFSRAMTAIYREVGVDLSDAAWVQVMDGVVKDAWTEDELDIDITNPSVEANRIAYGRGSAFQRSMQATELLMSIFDYNQGLFATDYPETMLLIYGEYSPTGLENFIRQMTSQVGRRNWQRMAVVPARPEFKAEIQKLRDNPREMVYEKLINLSIALKSAAFGMHPSEINSQIFTPNQRQSSNDASEIEKIEYAKEEGFRGLLSDLSRWINRNIVEPRYPDLEFRWEISKDTERERITLSIQASSSYRSINESRKLENKPPIKKEWADYPLPIAQQYAMSELQIQQMKEQQKINEKMMNNQQGVPAGTPPTGEPKGMLGSGPGRPPGETANPGQSIGSTATLPGMPKLLTPKKTQKNTAQKDVGKHPIDKNPMKKSKSATLEREYPIQTIDGHLTKKLDEIRTIVKIGGRAYILETTMYGSTWRGLSGGVLYHTDVPYETIDEATRDFLEVQRSLVEEGEEGSIIDL